MDETRFDAWIRAVSTPESRRAATRLLAGGALAGLLTQRGPLSAPAKNKGGKGKGKGKGKDKKKKSCPRGQKVCTVAGKSTCIPQEHCCSDIDDCSRFECRNEFCLADGSCGCLEGQVPHNGRCGWFPDCLHPGEIEENGGGRSCCGFPTIQNFGTDEDPLYLHVCQKSIGPCSTDSDCEVGPCRGFLCMGKNALYPNGIICIGG